MFNKKDKNTYFLVRDNVTKETKQTRQQYFKREYPTHVPAFVQYGHDNTLHRYVLPHDSTFGHFLIAFRRKVQLSSTEALMALVEKHDGGDVIKSYQIPSHKTFGELSNEYLNDDGYLYINMTLQHTFG